MNYETDIYMTIEKPFEGELFKDKGSKFLGFAFPVQDEDQVRAHLVHLKSLHHKARHWCYAWRIGTEEIKYRSNDDGEPSNSAGQPILGQLLSFDVTNVLVVVVRYFGGVKLGVGGLISAYRTAAKFTLETSDIIKKTVDVELTLTFEYEHMDRVMRIIKDRKLKIVSQKMELNCVYTISVRKNEALFTKAAFENLRCLLIK